MHQTDGRPRGAPVNARVGGLVRLGAEQLATRGVPPTVRLLFTNEIPPRLSYGRVALAQAHQPQAVQHLAGGVRVTRSAADVAPTAVRVLLGEQFAEQFLRALRRLVLLRDQDAK